MVESGRKSDDFVMLTIDSFFLDNIICFSKIFYRRIIFSVNNSEIGVHMI